MERFDEISQTTVMSGEIISIVETKVSKDMIKRMEDINIKNEANRFGL